MPPPGHYWPLNFDLVRKRVLNAGYTMRTRGDRFKASTNTFTHAPHQSIDHVGPGSYEWLSTKDGKASTVAGESRREAKDKGASASFRSESVRDLSQRYFANEAVGYSC